jgi:phage/plasmid-like protein (TIGR03299 family)
MAHEVESMMFVGETPWHKLGKYVGDRELTSAEAIKEAELSWPVEKRKLFYQLPDGNFKEQGEVFGLVRGTDQKYLSFCGKKYTPFQNEEAFQFFDEVVGQKAAIYHTAGSLQGGRMIWILAKLNGIFQVKGDDVVERYLLLMNRHQGGFSARILCTPIRVVCANTLSMAINGADVSNIFRVRHSSNVMQKVKDIQDKLANVDEYFKKVLDASRLMAGQDISSKELDEFLISLDILRANEREADVRKFLKERNAVQSGNIRQEAIDYSRDDKEYQKVMELFEKGKGNDMPGIKGTWWAAYNAVTEYVDWYSPIRQTKKNKSLGEESARLDSAWFGGGNNLKQNAFSTAMDMIAKS